MKNKILVHAALFSVALLYGGNYIIAKGIMPGIFHPSLIILFRVIFGLFFFWGFALLKENEKLRSARDYFHLALAALLGIAVNQLFFFNGLSMTSPFNASLVMTTTPILVLLASRVILKEKISWTKLVGVLLGFSGAVLLILVTFQQGAVGTGNWKGDVMVLINASSYGLYLVVVKPLIRRYHTHTVVKWLFLFGTLYVIPFGINYLDPDQLTQTPSWAWLNLLYILIGVTVLAYFLNAWALNYASPSLVGIYIYLQPVLAGMISLILGMDELSPGKLIAGLLIFLGVYLVSIRR